MDGTGRDPSGFRNPKGLDYYANRQRVAMRQGGVVYYVHQDHLGSIVAVSDQDGQAVGRVQYDPYGEIISSTLPVALTDRLFTGQRWYGTNRAMRL